MAGHLIECGAQATGGLWCNWQETPTWPTSATRSPRWPRTARSAVTKPPGTGGAVNLETVAEQLLYEVGDPAAYLTPDVVADFTSVALHRDGPRRGARSAARAASRPRTRYKVSIAYRDGFAASGTLVIAGPDAAAKARRCGEMILDGCGGPALSLDSTPDRVPRAPATACRACCRRSTPPEVVLRVAVARRRARRWSSASRKEFAPLVTSGPPGVTGYTTGRPAVREVFAYWPALIAKTAVTAQVSDLI